MAPKKADIILIACLLVLAIFAAIFPFLNTDTGSELVVLKNNVAIHRLPLSEDTKLDLITNVVVIKNGEARVQSANCPDKVCVHHKAVSKKGESIICVPNGIVLEVE